MTKLTAEFLFDDLTPVERTRAERVESILTELRDHAEEADSSGRFYEPHRETLANAGLLGLVIPEAYGGLVGGRAVTAACAADFKSLQLELGCNNAMVVLEDADIDKVADGIVAGMTTLNGKCCRVLGRLIVHESIQDQVVKAAMDKFKSLNVGDALSMESQFGPLANLAHHIRIVDAVNALKAKDGQTHHSAPTPDSKGYYLSPTLITGVAPEETLEEIFGPVATIHAFKTDEEAVKLANQTPYGLGGYVYSKDEDHAMQIARQINTGGVKVNGVSLLELNVDAPRPAWGLSGFGEEGTLETFDVFCGKSVVGVAGKWKKFGYNGSDI